MNLGYRVPDVSDSNRGKLRRFLLLAIEVCIWNPRTCFFSVPSDGQTAQLNGFFFATTVSSMLGYKPGDLCFGLRTESL